jgi:hypothetical protein
MNAMSIEELRELCALTVELTRLRQNECKHLAIENFAPELLGKLLAERHTADEREAFVAGFISAGGETVEAQNQAAQFLECVRAGKPPNAAVTGQTREDNEHDY